jgi:hypothetical protein
VLAFVGAGCGRPTSVPFAAACTQEYNGKLVSIEGAIDQSASLTCEVHKYDKKSGFCRFQLRAADGSSDSAYSLEMDKGEGTNEVSLGGEDRIGLNFRFDPTKVVFTDRAGKKYKYEDRIRVVAKIQVDPVVNPDFPPSCSLLEVKSFEFVAAGVPGERQAQASARRAAQGKKGRTMACTKQDEINVSGIEENVEVTGECASLQVSGADNHVTIEAVGRIGVSGSNNSIRWRRGAGGADPKISKSGVENKVERLP